ncbi:TOMM precursor leader peptide-binding protein [Streptomyces morookaense]|uniref:TOMM leader peptide-binding protein n=1 Tax=Streptomyces morookaense TaxID=1970 RepID=A0A7Y7AZB5_STRMO|nr:TOMM precursor leader peptide-binding protein [Streptomyces morookaense]NVK76107.1 TOMM precursor leader peptide-binding protein [Streptomyces morookaense]
MGNGTVRIKRSLTVVGHSPDVVELRSGVWNKRSYTLTDDSGSGKLLTLVRSLDGSVTSRELAKREGVSRAEVESLVDHLLSLGAVESAPQSALDAYVDTIGALRLATGPGTKLPQSVLLLGDPGITATLAAHLDGIAGGRVLVGRDDEPAVAALASAGPDVLGDELALAEFAEAFEPWREHLVIVADTVIHPVRLTLLSRLSGRLGFPWLHAAVDGPFVLVGPTFVPGRSACYECFETRVTMNLRENASYLRYKEALAEGAVRHGTPAVLGPLKGLLACHTALEATNYLATGATFTIEKVLGIHVPTMEIAYHEVLRLPGCPGCGSVAGRDDTTVHFDARAWLDDTDD